MLIALLTGATGLVGTLALWRYGDRLLGSELEIFEGKPPVKGGPLVLTVVFATVTAAAVALLPGAPWLLGARVLATVLMAWAVLCDVRNMMIPNRLSVIGGLAVLTLACLGGWREPSFGALWTTLVLLGHWLLAFLVTKDVNAFGMGDVKMGLIIGASLGAAALTSYFSLAMPAAVFATYLMIRVKWPKLRKQPVPFLPTMALAWALLLWGMAYARSVM